MKRYKRSPIKELGLLHRIHTSKIHRSRIHQSFIPGVILALATLCVGAALAQEAPAASPSAPASIAKGNISSNALRPKATERWDTPSLEGSDLQLKETIPGGTDTLEGYTHELTRVQWRAGDPIDLYIIKPLRVKKPPVILYLYSYPFEMDRFLNHDFCKFLVKNGYAAVGFASALTAARYHTPRPFKEWFVSQLPESLATSAHDVQMILNYMASRGDVDMKRVGMFGDGSGATIAMLAAASDPRIKTLDLLDPWGDWPDWMAKSQLVPENERADYLKPEWLAAAAPLDPLKWLPTLKAQKIRLQFVKDIPVTPVDVQQRIEAAIPAGGNIQVVHYDSPMAFRAAVAGGTGFDWIKEKMQSSVAPAYRAAEKAQDKGSSRTTGDSQQ